MGRLALLDSVFSSSRAMIPGHTRRSQANDPANAARGTVPEPPIRHTCRWWRAPAAFPPLRMLGRVVRRGDHQRVVVRATWRDPWANRSQPVPCALRARQAASKERRAWTRERRDVPLFVPPRVLPHP